MVIRTQSSTSVKNLHALLIKVHAAPEEYRADEKLRSALLTQGALAKLDYSNPLITPMALNTLKSVANDVIDGGYRTVEACRLSALELLALLPSPSSRGPRTKDGLKSRTEFLEKQVAQYEEDLFHLSKAFWRSITEMRSLAQKSRSSALIEECAETEELLRGMASLMSRRMLEVVK